MVKARKNSTRRLYRGGQGTGTRPFFLQNTTTRAPSLPTNSGLDVAIGKMSVSMWHMHNALSTLVEANRAYQAKFESLAKNLKDNQPPGMKPSGM